MVYVDRILDVWQAMVTAETGPGAVWLEVDKGELRTVLAEIERLRAAIEAAHVYHHQDCHVGDGSQCDCGLDDWRLDAAGKGE